MNTMNKCIFFILTLFCFLAGRLYAETYPVAPARQGQWQQEITAFARVKALAESTLTMPFAVKITQATIQSGQNVSTAQILLRFKSPAFTKDISAYANSRRVFLLEKKQQKIRRQGIREHTLTRRDLISGKKQIVKTEAELERSWGQVHTDLILLGNDMKRIKLDSLLSDKTPQAVADTLSVLRAPFSGTILGTSPIAGQWIQANTPVFRLEDRHRIYVTVAVSEKMLADWLAGDTLIRKNGTCIRLHLVPGAARLDGSSGLRLLVFTGDNPNDFFGVGQWIHVCHRSPARPVVWIPENAVVSRNNTTWCIVKNNQNYVPMQIEVGTAKDAEIPVLSGLKVGQQVVYENAYELLYRDLKELVQFVD